MHSRDKTGAEVCTGGDMYRVWVIESRRASSRFSTYADPVDEAAWPSLYWADVSGGTVLPGKNTYTVTSALIETQQRELERAEGRGPLQWSTRSSSDVKAWFRYRQCLTQQLPLPQTPTSFKAAGGGASHDVGIIDSSSDEGTGDNTTAPPAAKTSAAQLEVAKRLMASRGLHYAVHVEVDYQPPPSSNDEPRCRAVARNASTMMVALPEPSHDCGAWCTGDARTRITRPYRGPKDMDRAKQGFRHIVKPAGCRYHWFEEQEVAACLAGRSVLNIGGSVANSLQRGFERVRNTLTTKHNWWWEFGRTGITNNKDMAMGKTHFNKSVVTTQFIHHPFRYGLTNVVAPDPKKVVALKSAAEWEKFMCGFDIVVFESAVHDLASPDRRAHRLMQAACSKPDAPCTDADLMPALHNESWRLDLMASYRKHLTELMGMWTRCRDARQTGAEGSGKRHVVSRAPFRPIFKLSTAPNPATEMKACGAEWGYNNIGYYLLVGNAVAREIVEAHGFEVFDPYPATQHAAYSWFDMGGKDSLHADAVSDLTTHMLLNQLC